MSEAREKIIAWVKGKWPTATQAECEAKADELINEILADLPEPTDESEVKERVKRKAGL